MVSFVPEVVSGLSESYSSLQDQDQELARLLVESGQAHIFTDWAPAGEAQEEKTLFFSQVRRLSANYPGGLEQYISNAKALLTSASKGENPLQGWVPSPPLTGFDMTVGSDEYSRLED